MEFKWVNSVAALVWIMLVVFIDAASWQLFVGASFVLFFAVRWRERDTVRTLTTVQNLVHILAGVAFPVFSTGMKSWMVHRGWTDEGGYANRFQHASWAMALTCVMLPLFIRWWRRLDVVDAAVITVGIVVALGVGVEMAEAYRKIGAPIGYQAHAFRDTMRDLLMNGIGAAGGFIVSWWAFRRDSGEFIEPLPDLRFVSSQ